MSFLQNCNAGLHELKGIFNKAAVRDRLQGLALGAVTALTFTGIDWICLSVGAGIGLLVGRRRLLTAFNALSRYVGIRFMADEMGADKAGGAGQKPALPVAAPLTANPKNTPEVPETTPDIATSDPGKAREHGHVSHLWQPHYYRLPQFLPGFAATPEPA
jgi:hypothetical protein